ncbi:MAG: amidohydrolase [Ruminococcaceae bacterium]|nr:amidohydrolase [Oscillospiraceae bacterium]
MSYVQDLAKLVENRKDATLRISDAVWGYAESRFQEFKSAKEESDYMIEMGFKVTMGIGGEDTAFVAEYGSGKPVIALLGEYDALSGLSQKADIPCHDPIEAGKDGHGCGHNLLGAASMAAAVALKDYMVEKNLPGTIRYYGCPAEENAGGKAFLVREGCFNDCDIALTWHPGWTNGVTGSGSLANFRVFYTFHGLSSHAAGAPHLGRSALDAVEIMNVGVNYMREHMIDEARIHYAVINTGGTAPNVVQSEAQVLYAIRAPKVTQVKELFERVNKCAQGAALITETTVDIEQVSAYSDYIACDVCSEVLGKHMEELLPIGYTEEEMEYAKKFQAVITDLDRAGLKNRAKAIGGKKANELLETPIWDFMTYSKGGSKGSTDVGDVSWVVPTGQFSAVTLAAGTPGHAWQVVAQGKGPIAHKGVLFAAKVLAASAYDFITSPELCQKAKENWLEILDGETYPGALPPDAVPHIW